MRQLTIYRGEALISQVPLTGKTIRLGRSKDNDVVLEDPGKGVSRNHAELRPEGDRYRLVDLDSQNGIWVSGERVPSVLLAPGVVAAMGPFRIAIDAESSGTQPFPPVPPDLLPDTGTELFSRPSPPPPAPAPAAAPVDGLGSLLDEANPATGRPAVPGAAAAPRPRQGARTSVNPPLPRPRGSSDGGHSYARTAMWAAIGVVLVAASAFAAYKLLITKDPPKPKWDGVFALNLANNGRCQEALDQHINPALQADPNNAEAQSLKEKCTAPPPTTSIPAPPPEDKTNAQKLDDADTALAAKDCQVALDTANAVLTADASDARAKDLVTKATECLNPTPNVVKGPPVDPVARIPPADGGLDPLPGETGKAYRIRVDSVLKKYNDAVTLLLAQKHKAALSELDAIANTPGVPQGYKELAQRRTEARSGLREEATRAYTAGRQAEDRAEWNPAIAAYERAHDLDSRDVSADVARVNAQKVKLGREACAVAAGKFSLGKNDEARANYNKVLELLPSSDPCYAEAKQKLTIIPR